VALLLSIKLFTSYCRTGVLLHNTLIQALQKDGATRGFVSVVDLCVGKAWERCGKGVGKVWGRGERSEVSLLVHVIQRKGGRGVGGSMVKRRRRSGALQCVAEAFAPDPPSDPPSSHRAHSRLLTHIRPEEASSRGPSQGGISQRVRPC
jgi:hypothetical protein